MKKTRKMVASLVAIVICFAMLLGTTYAWFTDSVINTNNIIKSGNVDVELWHKSNENTSFEEVDGATKLFVNTANDPILWEPGASATETFEVRNVGSLALKYELRIKAVSKTFNANNQSLEEVLTLTVGGEKKDFGVVLSNTLEKGADPINYDVKIEWKASANDNDFVNLKLLLGIELVATQDYVEVDGSGNPFDVDAQLPEIPVPVLLPEEATEPMTISGVGANAPKAELPADLINELPDTVEAISLQQSEPIVDTENNKVTFESVEFYDQDGDVIDLSANDKPFTVTFTVPSLANMPVNIYHDDVFVDTVNADANGVITYEATHFCEVMFGVTEVSTADELIEALGKGESVILTDNIKIDPANMSNAYGTTGINIKNGQSIYGAGHTIDIKGAGGTWDSGINTTGGLIKDLKVTGSFRGIFINHNSEHSEKVVLENVVIDGTTYTISCDQGKYQDLEATNCTFNGWTSFAKTLGNAKFVDCYFGEGNGYAYCRPYAPTEFVGCEFEAGYKLDARAEVTLENCTIGGVAITTDNLATLVTSNIANAKVK